MKTPHKHAELIKAWADGAEIEIRGYEGRWNDCPDPTWHPNATYRIKPETKPYVVKYVTFGLTKTGSVDFAATSDRYPEDQIKITFCGETGNFKAAEVLK
jgi:hypothetical protein